MENGESGSRVFDDKVIPVCKKGHSGELIGRTQEMLLRMGPVFDVTPHLDFFCSRNDIG